MSMVVIEPFYEGFPPPGLRPTNLVNLVSHTNQQND
jgi:hypothetical protein